MEDGMERIVEEGGGGRRRLRPKVRGKRRNAEESDPNLQVGSLFRASSPASSIRMSSWKSDGSVERTKSEWKPALDKHAHTQLGGPGLRNGCSCRSRALKPECTCTLPQRVLLDDFSVLGVQAVRVVPVVHSGCPGVVGGWGRWLAGRWEETWK